MAVFESTVPAATSGVDVDGQREDRAADGRTIGFVQVTVPLAPTAGVVHDQPATAGSETKVVPAGSVSLHDALAAASGPLFVTVIV